MAPRDDNKSGGNGAEEPKAEKGMATLSTLRYAIQLHHVNNSLIDDLFT